MAVFRFLHHMIQDANVSSLGDFPFQLKLEIAEFFQGDQRTSLFRLLQFPDPLLVKADAFTIVIRTYSELTLLFKNINGSGNRA
jgi:hypothetical protein